ncbi:MAG: hypothetical protein KBT34_08015 [Prevotella sp.]|nr:hypothetical protein [Candidatus Prevotella equi]
MKSGKLVFAIFAIAMVANVTLISCTADDEFREKDVKTYALQTRSHSNETFNSKSFTEKIEMTESVFNTTCSYSIPIEISWDYFVCDTSNNLKISNEKVNVTQTEYIINDTISMIMKLGTRNVSIGSGSCLVNLSWNSEFTNSKSNETITKGNSEHVSVSTPIGMLQ